MAASLRVPLLPSAGAGGADPGDGRRGSADQKLMSLIMLATLCEMSVIAGATFDPAR